jgi:hypothetical protein
MRKFKKSAIALVALAGLLVLAGCASTNAQAEVKCGTTDTVNAQLKTANADLKKANANLDQAAGTARAVQASLDVKAAKATVTKLEACPPVPKKPASDSKKAPSPCGDAKFEQVAVDRSSTSKVEPRYDAKVRPIINNASLTPEQKVAKIKAVDLELAASNVQTLAFWANGLNLYDNPNSWQKLVVGGKIVNGACPTEAGKLLFAAYQGAYMAKGTTLSVGPAPANLRNTAINGNTAVVDSFAGLSGDLMAVTVTLPNGTKLIKLVRCGNVVFAGPPPPNVPPGKTDNPRCIYNSNLPPNSPDCLKPKGASIDNGNTPMGSGPLTDGHISQHQQETGQTSGNVTDHKVPTGTQSGSTTTDMGSNAGTGTTGSSGVTAPGATSGGDSQTGAPQDTGNTSSDTGGTSGATCVPGTDPFTGAPTGC